MTEVITAPLHALYHVLGYQVPTALRTALVSAPIALLERAVGKNEGILREGDWVMVAARYDAAKRRGEATAEGSSVPGLAEGAEVTRRYPDGITFSSLDFFGFGYNADAVLREQCFSNERYPYPLYGGHFHTIVGSMRRERSYARMGYVREEVRSGHDGCSLVLEWKLCDATKFPNGPKGIVAMPQLYLAQFVHSAVRPSCHGKWLSLRCS